MPIPVVLSLAALAALIGLLRRGRGLITHTNTD